MHNQLRYLIMGSSLLLGACDVENEFDVEQPEAGEPTDSMDEIQSASGAEPRAMAGLDYECTQVKAPIIARINPNLTTCKFPGFEQNFGDTWEAVSLFGEGQPLLTQFTAELPTYSPLREFCRYDYLGNASDPYDDYAVFLDYLRGPNAPNGVDGGSAAGDCPVIAPMTDQGLDTAAGREALHDAFMANIHAIKAADLQGVTRYATKLVLLDTVAEGEVPTNEHGLQLEAMIADIACPGDTATCLDWIEHVLVTPRSPADDFAAPDWNGGTVGMMHELSMGIALALLDWSHTNLALQPSQRQRLVLNASVGADPEHPIASDPAFAPAQSAIVALQAAYCMGAVVYAAAGNTRDNSCANEETEMLVPAKWEDNTVPSAAQCAAWGYVADLPSYTYSPGSPLIHAVMGVDHTDTKIANHRWDAYPRLAATASDALSSNGTAALTGTSVASAVASAAHLLSWSLNPSQRGASVAANLFTTGYSTSIIADSGMYAGNTRVHRLSVCHSVASALGLSCGSAAPDADNLDGYKLAIDDAIAEADLLPWQGNPLGGTQANCSAGPQLDVFIHPQPDRPICHHCVGELALSGNTHMLERSIINEQWAINLDVSAAKLYTYDAGGTATVFDLGAVVPDINNANPSNVIQVQFTVPTPASAALEFLYCDAYYNCTKQSNPIPLL